MFVEYPIDDVAHHAESTYPRECCGLIVKTSGGQLISRAGVNQENGLDLFELDARTIVQTHRRNESITGLYHSHCDGPAEMSSTDIRALVADGVPLWPGVDIFIASVKGGHCVCVQRFVWSDLEKSYQANERHLR